MSNLKECLDYVCNIFNYFGICGINPEELRKSKYN